MIGRLRVSRRPWLGVDRLRLPRAVLDPVGILGVVLVELAMVSGLHDIGPELRHATTAELLDGAGWVLIGLAVARVAGVRGGVVLVLGLGGAAMVVPEITSPDGSLGFVNLFWILIAAVAGSPSDLPKEEFDRRYSSPPGLFPTLKLRKEAPAGASWPVPPVEVGASPPPLDR